jgi:hypothetical protein
MSFEKPVHYQRGNSPLTAVFGFALRLVLRILGELCRELREGQSLL